MIRRLFRRRKEQREEYPFSHRTVLYLGVQKSSLDEYAKQFEIVYVAPVTRHAEDAACAIYAHLYASLKDYERFNRDVSYSVFNIRSRSIHTTYDRPHSGNAGLIAVDIERNNTRIRALSDERLKRYGITSVFYTWIWPSSTHEIITIP